MVITNTNVLIGPSFLLCTVGPGSWFSICSKPGVSWVHQTTGVTDFAETARVLTSTWTRRLKIDRNRLTTKIIEPDPETAWKYSAGMISKEADK